jgi:outer membrane lipoprotein-sorting protein
MHRLRRCAPVALALLLSLPLSSCSLGSLFTRARTLKRGGKTIPPGTTPPPLRSATREELSSRITNLYNAINSFQATVDMTPSVGSVYQGKINEGIVGVHAFVLFRKPSDIQIIGQAPVVRTQVFDMVSTGNDFKIYIDQKNLFIEGSNSAPATSKNALENLRPEAFLSSMLIKPMDPATEKAVIEDHTDEETALYQLLFIRTAPDGQLVLARSVWFDRLDLSIVRQQAFDDQGTIVSDTRYLKWTPYNGVMFPAHIDISRNIDRYGVTMDIVEMQMNQALTDDKFILKQPDGSTLRQIGATQGGPQGGTP